MGALPFLGIGVGVVFATAKNVYYDKVFLPKMLTERSVTRLEPED